MNITTMKVMVRCKVSKHNDDKTNHFNIFQASNNEQQNQPKILKKKYTLTTVKYEVC